MKRVSPIFLGTIVFFAGTVLMPLALQAAPTITATLTASPSSLTAYCPATITFTGAIKVDNVIKAPVVIQYKFVRSDGGLTAPITLNCPGAGVYPVKNTWTLGATYSGWEAIEVISPVSVKSEKAPFTLTCLPKPQITNTLSNPCLRDSDIWIMGQNFGAAQGNKNVTLDGTPALPKPGWSVLKWTDDLIVLRIRTCDIIIWEHPYQIAITDGGQVVSNVVSTKFDYQMTVHGGQLNFFAGQAITLDVRDLPPASSGYVLRLYAAGASPGNFSSLPITKWTGAVGCTPGTITATIPQGTLPNHYGVTLYIGNTWVSSTAELYVVKLQKPPLVIKK